MVLGTTSTCVGRALRGNEQCKDSKCGNFGWMQSGRVHRKKDTEQQVIGQVLVMTVVLVAGKRK